MRNKAGIECSPFVTIGVARRAGRADCDVPGSLVSVSARKSERIMNLTICLLMARRFVEREQIRELVEGYQGLGQAAFERTFERDKEELRALGVPVETGSNDPLFPDDVGYRIRRRDFELPPLEFDAGELAALGVAAGVWDSARLADHATSAVAKLRASGLDPDASRVAGFAPSVGAHEPGFEVLWQATLEQRPVAFRYRQRDRVVEPWRLTSRNGAWYLIGLDRTRGEGRSFKLSRLESEARFDGEPATIALPAPHVVTEHLASLEAPRDAAALIAVRDGTAGDLIRFAEPADPADPGSPADPADPVENAAIVPDGFSIWRIELSRGAAGDLAWYGADVIVLAPASLVREVRSHLEAVAAWA